MLLPAHANTTILPPILDFILADEAVCGDAIVQASEMCDDGNAFSGDYCATTCNALGPLAQIGSPGRWGTPENTFILTDVFDFDLQTRFPEVNWQTLDRLYIPAGEYNAIWLGNLPVRSADRPLIISNYGGQVTVTDNPNSKFVIEGGSNWVLTGRYDEQSQTGHKDFIGHANGNYPASQGNYGIYIKQGYQASNGLTVREGRASSYATDFELEFIEIAEAGFAAINIKNDNNPDAHMRNVKIHDLYIRDPETECMYIGNTNQNADAQHRFENLWVFNNRGVRCGAEGLQVSHIADGSRLFNNVFFMASADWKDPFQVFQEGHLQIVMRTGEVAIENNIFIGGSNTMISPRFLRGSRDPQATNEAGSLTLKNNYFSHSRGTYLSYIHRHDSNQDTALNFIGNTFGEILSQRDEIVGDSLAEDYFFQTKFNKSNPILFQKNVFEGQRRGYSTISSGINGIEDNLSAHDNVYANAPEIEFMDSGFAAEIDYRAFEVWSDCSRSYNNSPISYEVGDVVRVDSELYRLTQSLPSPYVCSNAYWAACDKNTDGSYSTNTYNIGAIVDTQSEHLYRLTSEHSPYNCAANQVFQNIEPFEDSAWSLEHVNLRPDTPAGAAFWQKVPLPNDDLRLSPSSPFNAAGLLDVVK